MHTRFLLTVGLTLVVSAGIAGCAATTSTPAPAPSVSSSPIETASPAETAEAIAPESIEDRLDQLRDSVAGTSVGCDGWVNQSEGPAGSIGGTCGGVWTLLVFDTIESRNSVLTLNQESLEPGRFIVGPGWLIRSDEFTPLDELDSLGAELGYPVWEHSDAIPLS